MDLWRGERENTKISRALDDSQAQLQVHQKGGKGIRQALACWCASAEALLPPASCLQVSDCLAYLSSSSGMAAGGRAKEAIHRSHRCAAGGATIKAQRHGRDRGWCSSRSYTVQFTEMYFSWLRTTLVCCLLSLLPSPTVLACLVSWHVFGPRGPCSRRIIRYTDLMCAGHAMQARNAALELEMQKWNGRILGASSG